MLSCYLIFAGSIDFREKSALFLFPIFIVSTNSVRSVCLGVIHISADAKKAHFGTPLADTMLTFSWDPPLADSQHTSKKMWNARIFAPLDNFFSNATR